MPVGDAGRFAKPSRESAMAGPPIPSTMASFVSLRRADSAPMFLQTRATRSSVATIEAPHIRFRAIFRNDPCSTTRSVDDSSQGQDQRP